MPYHGTGAAFSDAYTMRSAFVPAYRIGWDSCHQDIDQALLRRTVEDFRRVEKCLLGDFYPLTPYSLADNVWVAWQFDRPEAGDGVVQAFRRDKSPEETMVLKLQGLNPRAVYEVIDVDKEGATKMPGRELMARGLPVKLGSSAGGGYLLSARQGPGPARRPAEPFSGKGWWRADRRRGG